jgi:hypothetical protein
MTDDVAQQHPMQLIETLAGAPAEAEEIAAALEQSDALLAVLREVWRLPVSDVAPAATYSADWDEDLG